MAHPRKFRFGAELKGPFPGLTWQQTVQRVEELGYSTLFVPDHFQLQYGPITAMASAAAYSDTLHVGSLVFDNAYRHRAAPSRRCSVRIPSISTASTTSSPV